MRGLTLVLGEAFPGRARTALSLACATAALGARARLFLHEDAVALLTAPAVSTDARHAAAGLPTLAGLLEEALELGVAVIACQTGLALAGLDAARFDPRIAAGGLIGLLADLGEDRLVAA